MSKSDRDRVYAAVEKLLPRGDNIQYVIVNNAKLFRDCRLERMTRTRFAQEVQDILTNTALVREFGTWLYTEWELNTWLFVRVATVEESKVSADDILTALIKRGAAKDTTGYYANRRPDQDEDDEQDAAPGAEDDTERAITRK